MTTSLIMSKKEVAAALGICLSTLEKNVKKGLFPPPIKHSLLRVGWLTADIENFLKGNKSQEQPDKNA
ncbi:MAG: AlpA family phage regulatory protein [Desulfovibrionaceae bacterium]|nr:AlpA family phage regulatory protein [Desulfovibrionaceae bacterium]